VTFDDKLAELKVLTRDWERRYDEHEKRPEAVERLEVRLFLFHSYYQRGTVSTFSLIFEKFTFALFGKSCEHEMLNSNHDSFHFDDFFERSSSCIPAPFYPKSNPES